MKYILPQLTSRLAYSLELLTLFAVSWAILLGAVSELLGFSKEVGAFLAGVSLASNDYRESIGAPSDRSSGFSAVFLY